MGTFNEEPTKRIDWETPQHVFDYWNRRFQFGTDVCANRQNAKCKRYFSPRQNGLRQEWSGPCWMNPPYGRGMIGPWVKKAYLSAMSGDATVVCLLPNRSDNPWWEMVTAGEIFFVQGRLRFVGAPSGAKFPSIICVFHAHLDPGGKMRIVKNSEMKAEAISLMGA
jgi:phage N-6-adenine-methyltransferase